MGKERLHKFNTACIAIVIISALTELFVISAIALSVYNETILYDMPDVVIKALAYIPWATLWGACLFRIYIQAKLKKANQGGCV